MQEITREREQMSQDLSNRSLTVKKLMEENAELILRIQSAQKEAHELVQFGRGEEVPERQSVRNIIKYC